MNRSASPDAYFYCPAVTVDANNTAYAVFNRSSSTVFIESRYAVKALANATFQPSLLLKQGQTIDFGYWGSEFYPVYWGGYNGSAIDPVSGSAWVSSMYATNDLYGTWVGNITSPAPGSTRITATFNPGTSTLTVSGDAGDNRFSVAYSKDARTLTLTATDKKTQVNGKWSEVFSGVDATHPITIQADLGGGNDSSQWTAIPGAMWNINLGDGNDTISVTNSTGTSLSLNGGPGVDVKTILLSKFGQSLFAGFP